MNISFHAWQAYKECPKKYFLQYRRNEDPTVPQNDYFRIYGFLVQRFFQMFSNIWRFKTPYMPPEFIRKKLNVLYDELLNSITVNWTGRFVTLSRDEIFEEAFTDICLIMDSENQNYFLNTQSEIEIEVSTSWGPKINGRLDFIHKNLDNSVLILDGKGSKKVKKNVDDNQLLFYALLYYFYFKRVPSRLGFFYYRYNLMAPLQFDLDVLNEFRALLSKDVRDIMSLDYFKATPCTKACKYCLYNNSCSERSKWQMERRKPSKISVSSEDGIVSLGF